MKNKAKAVDIDISKLNGMIERSALREVERDELKLALETLLYITHELEKKRVSVSKLKKMLFGDTTEKTSTILDKMRSALAGSDDTGKTDGTGKTGAENKPEKKPKGHGRNGAAVYRGADTVKVPHESLQSKDLCPECGKGTVYGSLQPERLVRLRGHAPIAGTVYELEKLRCNLCGKIFTAEAPRGVGTDKYDATSGSIMVLLKYGTGMPFHRLERLQKSVGIPLPSSTQWDIVAGVSTNVQPALKQMIWQAAQGDVLHNDDTTMKILELMNSGKKHENEAPEGNLGRTGIFTSAIVSKAEGHTIALFFTGRSHAGENLLAVLQERDTGLDPPIQMCDALSRNMPDELKTIVANCIAHGRRRFVDVAENFPAECLHVLSLLKEVYKNDATAREQGMTPTERLSFHQEQSGPWMKTLKDWCREQIEQHKVEPNSGLGEAIGYMRKHWTNLTLFLRQAGAPLDNNLCERVVKKAILHRKNAYFYRTENGARVGDLFMSLIHTCELCGANPFHYLTELQKHASELAAAPQDWMPWNYTETLAEDNDPSS